MQGKVQVVAISCSPKKIYNNKKLVVEFIDYAYRRLKNSYSSKAIAQKYSNLYNQVLKNP